jgi:protein tyrosine/serine phosphatase
MLGVHVDYLRQALDVIDDKYGSALNYMERELGVGEAERAALAQKLSA